MAKPHPNNTAEASVTLDLLRHTTLKTFHVISPFGDPSKDETLPASNVWLCYGRTPTSTGMPEQLPRREALILQYFYRGYAKITAFVTSMSRLGV